MKKITDDQMLSLHLQEGNEIYNPLWQSCAHMHATQHIHGS